MTTLRIEHPITDIHLWTRACDGFAEARARAGVTGYTVRHPVDDPHHVYVDLELPDVAAAESFREFLRSQVWARPEASPALAGEPVTHILEVARVG